MDDQMDSHTSTPPDGDGRLVPRGCAVVCASSADLLRRLPDGCAAMIHADPPWSYRRGKNQGNAEDQYRGMAEIDIMADLSASSRVAADDAYLFVWCTFPKLADWLSVPGPDGWRYLTGGAWGKVGRLGVGYHVRGDAEILLVYGKGSPQARITVSNHWMAPRGGHSVKPDSVLTDLVRMGSGLHDLVVDLYAGESASLARVARALGRQYVGAEIDPARHGAALERLRQGDLFSL